MLKKKESNVASTKKIGLVNEFLAKQFNIDNSFYITTVKDKGAEFTLGFENMDYEVTVKIKDTDKMGIVVDDYIESEED